MSIKQRILFGKKAERGNVSIWINGKNFIYEVGLLRALFIDLFWDGTQQWASHPLARLMEKIDKDKKP